MDCTGNESSLSQCSHAGVEIHDCSHLEDVGVSCGKDMIHSDRIQAGVTNFSLQSQHAMIQIFDWWVAPDQMKAEWNIVVKECGELCVMTCGIETMPWWCAGSWVYPQKVSRECRNMLKTTTQFVTTHTVCRCLGVSVVWWR